MIEETGTCKTCFGLENSSGRCREICSPYYSHPSRMEKIADPESTTCHAYHSTPMVWEV